MAKNHCSFACFSPKYNYTQVTRLSYEITFVQTTKKG